MKLIETMDRVEASGELKYSGLESGTTSWKQGSIVLHCKEGAWKLDLYVHCSRNGPVKSFQVVTRGVVYFSMQQSFW